MIEGAAKIIPQVFRARVPVRLEKNEDALEMADACGFERGANFDGMMAVIVDQSDVVDDAFEVKPAPHAGKFPESNANQFGRHIQIKRDGRAGCGVAAIVDSRWA